MGHKRTRFTYIDWEEYSLRTSGDNNANVCFSKYNTDSKHGPVDNKTQLELCDDAAHVNWGGKWRIPTEEQWVELLENSTREISKAEGRYIMTFTGPNGHSIIIPSTGDAPEDFFPFPFPFIFTGPHP